MNKLLIKNAYLVDPSQELTGNFDLLIENGLVAYIAPEIHDIDATVLDAQGLHLTPGLVDMHVHLRDPGYIHKEDIATGCTAAAVGGFTAIACMPNTSPVCDNADVVQYITGKAAHCKARVYPVCAITEGLRGEKLTDFHALKAAGVVAVSDDGKPVSDAKKMMDALRLAKENGLRVISHAEDLDIIGKGIINEGEVSRALGVPGMHSASEDVATAREIALVASSETAIHIAHVSTAGAAAFIRDAKARGVQVTAETAPHYLMFTEDKLLTRDANFRMNPPLRTEEDRLEMLRAVEDGTIDVIATDHAPHTFFEKADFERAPNGVLGLETSLAACLTALVHTGKISLSRLISMMSTRPCEILGIPGGTLKIGSPADITLFDLNEAWTVDKNKLHSKSQNTPFDAMTLKGKVKYTLLGGQITYTEQPE